MAGPQLPGAAVGVGATNCRVWHGDGLGMVVGLVAENDIVQLNSTVLLMSARPAAILFSGIGTSKPQFQTEEPARQCKQWHVIELHFSFN